MNTQDLWRSGESVLLIGPGREELGGNREERLFSHGNIGKSTTYTVWPHPYQHSATVATLKINK
jgi:hypothetical protein